MDLPIRGVLVKSKKIAAIFATFLDVILLTFE